MVIGIGLMKLGSLFDATQTVKGFKVHEEKPEKVLENVYEGFEGLDRKDLRERIKHIASELMIEYGYPTDDSFVDLVINKLESNESLDFSDLANEFQEKVSRIKREIDRRRIGSPSPAM